MWIGWTSCLAGSSTYQAGTNCLLLSNLLSDATDGRLSICPSSIAVTTNSVRGVRRWSAAAEEYGDFE